MARSGSFYKQKSFLELWAHKPHTKKPGPSLQQSGSFSRDTSRDQNYTTNGNFNHNSQDYQNNNMDEQNYNMNHNKHMNRNLGMNNNNNNMNRDTSMNHRNTGMNTNHMNPNAIGNDGFNDQRVNHFNSNSNKNVLFDTVTTNKGTHDLSSYQNQGNHGNRNINNTPAWMKNKDTPSKKARMFTLNGTLLNVGFGS